MSISVEFKLDKVRNVRFGMRELMKIEKELGKPFSQLDIKNIQYEHVAIILCAALQREDPDMTVDKLVDLIDEYSDIQTAIKVMGEGMELAFGQPKNAQAAKNPK